MLFSRTSMLSDIFLQHLLKCPLPQRLCSNSIWISNFSFWAREISSFSTTDKYFAEQSGMTSYPLFVCGQMVLLESPELAAALSALSRMEQEIIFLYYFQRLTHREIGRRYGRAGNTTGRRIQTILRRLRAELEGLSYEPATSL